MRRTYQYLTVRCPIGCETWLAPPWLDAHLRPGRCSGHPWVNDLPDRAVVPAPLAGALLSVLPSSLVEDSEPPTVTPAQRGRVTADFRLGVTIKSPIEGVRARKWVRVAVAALEQRGLSSVQEALTADGFERLDHDLIAEGSDVACPDCGESITTRGLAKHRGSSAACRWRRAAAEVREAWAGDWRDPYSVMGAPHTWLELSRTVHWRRRLLTVEFPRWTAVLLKPPSD